MKEKVRSSDEPGHESQRVSRVPDKENPPKSGFTLNADGDPKETSNSAESG